MKRSILPALIAGIFGFALNAQEAARGGALYKEQCASCHGENLQGRSGPPLAGTDFRSRWTGADLTDKIRNTMPQDKPGKLSAGQAADLASYIQQSGQSTAVAAPSRAAAAATRTDFPPAGNLTQLMRGIMFPNSNII